MKHILSIVLTLAMLLSAGCQSQELKPAKTVEPTEVTEAKKEPEVQEEAGNKEKKVVVSYEIEGIYNGIENGEMPKLFVKPHDGEPIALTVLDEFSPSKLEQFTSHEDYTGLLVAVKYQTVDYYSSKDEEFKRVDEIVDIELLESLPEVDVDRYVLAGFNEPELFDNFFSSLRIFVNSDEKEHLVELFSYPMSFHLNGELVNITDRYELLELYDEIFNPLVKFSINNQKPDDFHVSFEGVGIGSGQIWFVSDNKELSKVKISKVNNKLVTDKIIPLHAIIGLFEDMNIPADQLEVESIGDFGHRVRMYAGTEHLASYLTNEYLVFEGKVVDYKYDQDRNESYSFSANLELLTKIAESETVMSRPIVFYADNISMIAARDEGGNWYDNVSYGRTFDIRSYVEMDIYKESKRFATLSGYEETNVFGQGVIFQIDGGNIEHGYLSTDADYNLDIGKVKPYGDLVVCETYISAALFAEQIEEIPYRIKQAYSFDLEGDGVDELLINATTFPADYETVSEETFSERGFNMLFMVKDNQTYVLDMDIFEKGMYSDVFTDENIYQILDLDNDGLIEIVKETWYLETIGYQVYDFNGLEFETVVSSYVGP